MTERAPRFNLLVGSSLSPGTATTAGGIRLASSRLQYQPIGVKGQTTFTTKGLTAGRIYGMRIADRTNFNEYSTFEFTVTTPAAAGNTARLAIYASSLTTGLPDALVWYSGTLAIDSGGSKTTTFVAGTWVDATYSGSTGNLAIPAAVYMWAIIWPQASVTVRAVNIADVITLGATGGALGLGISSVRATTPPAYGVPPNPFATGVTYLTNATNPVLMLLPA